MKFLFEFVACFASPVADGDIVPHPSNDRRSETHALMQRRCKRKKRSSNSISSLADWKPSLTSISEDNALVLEERKLKRRSHGDDSRTPRRSYEDRRDHFTAIPTFSATPFMF